MSFLISFWSFLFFLSIRSLIESSSTICNTYWPLSFLFFLSFFLSCSAVEKVPFSLSLRIIPPNFLLPFTAWYKSLAIGIALFIKLSPVRLNFPPVAVSAPKPNIAGYFNVLIVPLIPCFIISLATFLALVFGSAISCKSVWSYTSIP